MLLPGSIALVLAVAPAAGPSASEALAHGDAYFARRAEGSVDGTAAAAPVDSAIAAYRRALALDPSSFEVRLRLLRAFFFRGGFCGIEGPEKVKLFEEAKALAVDTVKRLEAGGHGSSGERHRAALGQQPLAAEIYLWAAISWGQWAVDHMIAAAWQGAAKQVRDLCQAVLDVEPETLQAGAYLILGRLHSEAPRIPMVTGWVSREKAVAYLDQAYARAPDNTANQYFLADALLRHAPGRRAQAEALLLHCASAPPRPDFLVEDAHYAAMARDRLVALGRRPPAAAASGG